MKKKGKKWRRIQKAKEERRKNMPQYETSEQVCTHYTGTPFWFRAYVETGITLNHDGTINITYKHTYDGTNLKSLIYKTRKGKCYCKKCKTEFLPTAAEKINTLIQYLQQSSWAGEQAAILAEGIEPIRYRKESDNTISYIAVESEYYPQYHKLFFPKEKDTYYLDIHRCNHFTDDLSLPQATVALDFLMGYYAVEKDFYEYGGDKFYCRSLLTPISDIECQCLNCKKIFPIESLGKMNQLVAYLTPESCDECNRLKEQLDTSEIYDKDLLIRYLLLEDKNRWTQTQVNFLSIGIEPVYYRKDGYGEYEYVTADEYANRKNSICSVFKTIRTTPNHYKYGFAVRNNWR